MTVKVIRTFDDYEQAVEYVNRQNRGESLAVSFHETEPSNIARYGIKETMVWNMQHPDTVRTTARFVVYEQRTFRQQGTAA